MYDWLSILMIITSFDCTIPSCTFPILHHFPFFFQIHFCLSHGGKEQWIWAKVSSFKFRSSCQLFYTAPLLKAKIFFACSNQSLNMGEGSSSFFSFHYYWSPLNYIYIHIYNVVKLKEDFQLEKHVEIWEGVVHHKRGKKKSSTKACLFHKISNHDVSHFYTVILHY